MITRIAQEHTPVLPQQEADFTAEGAPPPGHVGDRLPADPGKDTPSPGTPEGRPAHKSAQGAGAYGA